jgi:hypothetical protein
MAASAISEVRPALAIHTIMGPFLARAADTIGFSGGTMQGTLFTQAASTTTWSGKIDLSNYALVLPVTMLTLSDNATLGMARFAGSASVLVARASSGDAHMEQVDAFDLNLLAAQWQASQATWAAGDFTNGGNVSAFDLNVLAANWQFGFPGQSPSA